MEIIIDFNEKRTLGNVYNNQSDNFKSFNEAKVFYSKSKIQVDAQIEDALMLVNAKVGAIITIPLHAYSNKGFLKSLIFEISELSPKNAALVLKSVGH